MKNRGGNGQQAALAVQQEIFDMPKAKIISTIDMAEQALYRQTMKSSSMESCEACRFMLLEDENRRLENIVEDLKLDKLSQAKRLKELNEEKSRLRDALAEMMLDNHNLKQSIK